MRYNGAERHTIVHGGEPLLNLVRPTRRWQRYLWSALLVAATTLLSVPVHRFVSPANLGMLYLAAVVIAAIYLGRGPAALCAVAGVLAFDFFFVQPRLSLTVANAEYLLTFVGFLVVGLVISTLAARSREQAEAAQRREAEAIALYELSRDLASAGDLGEILPIIVRHVGGTFGRDAAVLLASGDALPVRSASPGLALSADELAAAARAFKTGQPAGRGTETMGAVGVRFMPLRTSRGAIGVLGVKPVDSGAYLSQQQRRLLEVFASQAALAIERAELAEQARQAQVARAAEELQAALLNSVSHDLRTPLVSITGTLSSLEDDGACGENPVQRSLISMAREEAERLNGLVGNLLDMTRIEAGALRATEEPCDIQEVIDAALDRLGPRLAGRTVTVEAAELLAPMDFVLMVQVLTNLVENAVKYSPPDAPIHVTARRVANMLELAVEDRGAGVPPVDLARIFDKFYRAPSAAGVSGTGLGLAICKGIVEAQCGRIWAENRAGGGLIVKVVLPLGADAQPQGEDDHE